MAAASLEALETPANGIVLTLAKSLSKAAVEAAFQAASKKANRRLVLKQFREKKTYADQDFYASLACFKLSGPPPFFPKTLLKEQTYGFLLLIEIELDGAWFLGIFRHAAASINDWIEKHAQPLPRTKLVNAFSDGAAVRKLSLQRMTASKYELRAASYEGASVETSLPTMAAGRCAIRSVRFSDSSRGSVGIVLNTSRVQRSGGRTRIKELAGLVIRVVKETRKTKPSPFLSRFAQAIPLSELPTEVVPNGILFDWTSLLEEDSYELCRSPGSGRRPKEFRKGLLTRLLRETMKLSPNGDAWDFLDPHDRVAGTFVNTATKYSITRILGDKLIIKDSGSGDSVPLKRWIRENDAFNITYDHPEYFYGSGALYHRADFAREVEAVKVCLRATPALTRATSEKGEPQKSSTRFSADSIFGVVEDSIYNQRDWLCCVDLGDEWADYLCIGDNKLILSHCKDGDTGLGATPFQEVVGQALKNLGRVQATPQTFETKLRKTEKKRFWGSTKIERLRDAGRKWADFRSAVSKILANPDAGREVHLVVTMLSFKDFDRAVSNSPSPNFIQLVWLLASFISSCREMGARPVIICKV